jgi:hypothetical protein
MGAAMAIAMTLSLPLRQNWSAGQHSRERGKRLPTKRHVEYPSEGPTGRGCCGEHIFNV